jgi:peptide deformylase
MPLPIVHYNDPILRKKGNKITEFDNALAIFGRQLVETMHEAGGIGLAAQQVGRAAQVCVVDLRESDAKYNWELDGGHPPVEIFMPMVIVNPQVEFPAGVQIETVEEGCLSFPEIRGDVARREAIRVKFQDEKGIPHILSCDGLLARCILHEMDHLNGVLFIDRMDKKTRAGLDDAIRSLARQTREEAQSAPKPSS